MAASDTNAPSAASAENADSAAQLDVRIDQAPDVAKQDSADGHSGASSVLCRFLSLSPARARGAVFSGGKLALRIFWCASILCVTMLDVLLCIPDWQYRFVHHAALEFEAGGMLKVLRSEPVRRKYAHR